MENDLLVALINDDKDYIKEKYNLLDFQIDMILFIYKNLNKMGSRTELVNDILKGKYNEEYKVRSMARLYVGKLIDHNKEQAKTFLCGICGYNEEEATRIIDTYVAEERALYSMLSMEVDVSNVNKRMNQMLDDVIDVFIENQKQKML